MPLQNLLTKDKFAELLTQFAYRRQICSIADTIYLGTTNQFLTKLDDIMNLLRKKGDDEYPCRLGYINNPTKILTSRPSDHGWRGIV
jgi:hypothetical protein